MTQLPLIYLAKIGESNMTTLNETYKIAMGPPLQEKIPPGSPYWNEFNGSFQNCDLKLNELATAVYTGRPFTTWHDNGWRHSKNYLLGQHLGVDFDTEDKRSSIPYLLKDSFVAKYASLIYTTPSHTIDAPRARVVFLLDTPIMQAKNYALAAAALLWIFSTADRQCKDAARFFYGAGIGADMELLPGILPLDKVKEIITGYTKTGIQQKITTVKNYQPRNADEKEVQSALAAIPPWGVEYDTWVSVLMAIHSEFPDSNGLAMAEAWGQGYAGEVRRKWKSFDSGGNVQGRISIATVFGIAKEHGYKA